MKIMYLLFSFTVGGAEKLVVDMCNEMILQNHDVHLYIINDMYSENLLKSLHNKVNIELQNRKVRSNEKIATILKVTEYIRKNKIDVVHCNSFNAPMLLLLKFFLFRHTRIVHTIHDVGQYYNLSKWEIIFRNILCDSFISISNSVKKELIAAGASKTKVKLVYNAIDLTKFNNSKNGRFEKNHVVIGNVARIIPEKKGQDILIDAIEKLKNTYPSIECKFAGGYDELHREAYYVLRENVKNKGLSNNVTFLGNIENIPSFLEKIDIFVLPSRYEGFGISLIEAMSMGIPCIASDLDGPSEIIGNNERGELFQVGNIDELESKIKYVINHYGEYIDKQSEIRKYVWENFDIKQMTIKLLEIYIGGK